MSLSLLSIDSCVDKNSLCFTRKLLRNCIVIEFLFYRVGQQSGQTNLNCPKAVGRRNQPYLQNHNFT